jgi:5,6,7,8-tetrahydromethanopterin hydro-lyase
LFQNPAILSRKSLASAKTGRHVTLQPDPLQRYPSVIFFAFRSANCCIRPEIPRLLPQSAATQRRNSSFSCWDRPQFAAHTPHKSQGALRMSMFIGEALAGEGNEIAHIDLLIGDKEGPVGNAFANALARQSEGHSNLLAVLTPNLLAKPATVMITKVTIKGAKQAVQMFGPAQAAVAKAVADSVAEGVISKKQAEDFVCVCGVFIHWEAADDRKIYEYNYTATKDALKNAMTGKPSVDEMIAGKDKAAHPFRGF